MSWDIRPCASPEEVRAATGPIAHYFGRAPVPADQAERILKVLPPERMHAVWEDGRAVGGAGAFRLELTVPGGRVPAAGVAAVGVLPTHRRRGILRALMRAQLDSCRERGEPVAYLWASEDTIYGRFGYGMASLAAEIDLPRERASYHAVFEPLGRARILPLKEAHDLVAPVYERVAAETPGMFARSSAWWEARVLTDPEWRRQGRGELQCVVIDAAHGPAAYALYRLTSVFERGVQSGSVSVVEALGDSPAATGAIWRYLLDVDWMARVKASLLPVDHALILLLAEPRRLNVSLRDGLWVRLVDLGAALSGRRYAARDAVVVEVIDAFCPWNEGRWRVSEAGAERAGGQPELRCGVTALGSAYLGGFSWAELARGLRVAELRSGAIARADALFQSDRAPWCPEIF